MRYLAILLLWLFCQSIATADEMRPAALRLSALPNGDTEVVWQLPLAGDDRRLPLRLTINQQPFDEASALGYRQGTYWISRLTVAEPSPLTVSVSGLSETKTELLISVTYPDGKRATERLQADEEQLVVDWRAGSGVGVWAYLGLGFEHILIGADHLLFVAALMLLVTRLRMLVWTITSFTVAHSLTLAAASMGWLQLPIAPVEAVIALSIVFVAREVVMRERGEEDISSRQPWLVAFCFGLLHGLGFASVLAEIGLPADARVPALVLFNIGVELGQLCFVALLVVLHRGLKRTVPATWFKPAIASYAIGTVAAFWMIERTIGF
ncbi:MAG TPA: HupE/UreJ family protein [Pseudomonadales bacterium]|nr:HupE/UreJ family protein [Pseudomonadales bacterium]